jgi:methyltransferase (TIGR00027 family)
MKENTPSATALVVARNVALIAATPGLAHLVPPDAAELTGLLLHAYRRRNDTFLRQAQRPWFRLLFHWYERCTIPGLALHQALRKRHIERIVRASLAEGFEQVIILGGGLDTLALRLHKEYPAVNFLELDHPATQRLKRDVIASRRLAGGNLRLNSVDLAEQPLQDFLAANPDFEPHRRTLFLSEGVLMYLAPEEVDHLFTALWQQKDPAVRFLFTFMERDEQGRPAFRNATWLVRLWLRLKREPFRWGLPRAAVAEFLEARGFHLKELVTAETFRHRDLQGDRSQHRLAEGEILCVADKQLSASVPRNAPEAGPLS